MSDLLNTLINEYKQLKVKLIKVEELIKAYGGTIPGEPSPEKFVFPNPPKSNFPIEGSWKDKILYVLKKHRVNGATSAKEIADEIIRQEKDFGISFNDEEIAKYQSMVTQYTSTMGKAGELHVEYTSHRNYYSYKD